MRQPVVIYFMADQSFMSYGGGVYSPTSCTTAANHVMLVVGYDTSGPTHFWTIKNSWGGWGARLMWGRRAHAVVAESRHSRYTVEAFEAY